MNLRVELTKKLLRDALVELLASKELRLITVKELCAAAGVNKSTLYAHYDNLYALYDDAEAGFTEATVEANARYSGAEDAARRRANYRNMCAFYHAHRAELVAFYATDAGFLEKMSVRFVRETSEHFSAEGRAAEAAGSPEALLREARLKMLVDCANYNYLHVVYLWLTEYEHLSIDDIVNVLMTVTAFSHGESLRTFVQG